jgi:hypothetical protein
LFEIMLVVTVEPLRVPGKIAGLAGRAGVASAADTKIGKRAATFGAWVIWAYPPSPLLHVRPLGLVNVSILKFGLERDVVLEPPLAYPAPDAMPFTQPEAIIAYSDHEPYVVDALVEVEVFTNAPEVGAVTVGDVRPTIRSPPCTCTLGDLLTTIH